MFNKHTIIGNLTKDPELKQIDRNGTQTPVCNVSVACNREFGDGVDFFDVELWGKQAEFCAQWGTKGRLVVVEGPEHKSQYKNKEGATVNALRLRATTFRFLDKKPNVEENEETTTGNTEDDLPF